MKTVSALFVVKMFLQIRENAGVQSDEVQKYSSNKKRSKQTVKKMPGCVLGEQQYRHFGQESLR